MYLDAAKKQEIFGKYGKVKDTTAGTNPFTILFTLLYAKSQILVEFPHQTVLDVA